MTMQNYLPGMESEQRRRDMSMWYTPPDLAERVARWVGRPWRVLEPAAGRGALVKALLDLPRPPGQIVAVDADPDNVKHLVSIDAERSQLEIFGGDFCAVSPDDHRPFDRPFDLALMNPPYENDQDVAFILHALQFTPRVVGIFRSALLHGVNRRRDLWQRIALRRLVWLSGRPKFGGSGSPESDFVVLDIVNPTPLETRRREQHPWFHCMCEWWP